MNPTVLTDQLQTTFDSLGITELTGLMITITAMSGSFYFILGIIKPPISALWAKIKELSCYEVSVYVADPDYQRFNEWLRLQGEHTWFQRTYKVINSDEDNERGDYLGLTPDGNADSQLAPGFGTVLIKAPGFPFITAERQKVENKNVYKQTEILNFKIYSFRQHAVDEFFDRVITTKGKKDPVVYQYSDNWWQEMGKPKTVLPPLGEAAKELTDDIEYFINNAEEYHDRGIPYKRGYLLFGFPGTGKTSIIAYLAKKFGMNIYSLNSTTISTFGTCARDIKPRSIILIEDIDMTVAGESRRFVKEDDEEGDEKAPVTVKEAMREFLNALDGITEFEGHIIIATTNKKNVLDPALLRPGRIDKQIEIGMFTHVEQIQHLNRFYGIDLDPNDYQHIEDRTFAVLQDLCVNNLNDYDGVLKQL